MSAGRWIVDEHGPRWHTVCYYTPGAVFGDWDYKDQQDAFDALGDLVRSADTLTEARRLAAVHALAALLDLLTDGEP